MRPPWSNATARGSASIPDDEPAAVMERASVLSEWNTCTLAAPPAADTAAIRPAGPAATAFGPSTPGIVLLYEPSALYSWMRPLLRSLSDMAMRPGGAEETAMPVGSTNELAGNEVGSISRDRVPFGWNARTERSELWVSVTRTRIEPSDAAAAARGADRGGSSPKAAENLPASS